MYWGIGVSSGAGDLPHEAGWHRRGDDGAAEDVRQSDEETATGAVGAKPALTGPYLGESPPRLPNA